MAYVSQEKKAEIAPVIKALLKKYNLKGSLSVNNHSTLVLTVKSGAIDFIKNHNAKASQHPRYYEEQVYQPVKDSIDVNTYWINDNYTGKAKEFLNAAKKALEGPGFFNNDDSQSDYFHRSHYIDISVGKWNKPYVLTK